MIGLPSIVREDPRVLRQNLRDVYVQLATAEKHSIGLGHVALFILCKEALEASVSRGTVPTSLQARFLQLTHEIDVALDSNPPDTEAALDSASSGFEVFSMLEQARRDEILSVKPIACSEVLLRD